MIICAPFTCSEGACRTSCGSDADCASGHSCINGSCGRKNNGANCTSDTDCATGHCFDGVCCSDDCRGPCVSCNLPGAQGTCMPIAAGVPDPHAGCQDTGPASCGTSGLCDGARGCSRYDETTICMRGCAADGSEQTIVRCDGLGMCGHSREIVTCPTNRCSATMPACF
jgi:hypothetical protein